MNKLRAIILLAALTAYTFCATAQNVADSVRIKIKTTAGAELYLDGEMSSTNIMTAKVPVGKHTVTIKVGYSFEQSYGTCDTDKFVQAGIFCYSKFVQLRKIP